MHCKLLVSGHKHSGCLLEMQILVFTHPEILILKVKDPKILNF